MKKTRLESRTSRVEAPFLRVGKKQLSRGYIVIHVLFQLRDKDLDRNKLDELCGLALQRIEESRYDEALGLARQIQSLGPHYYVSYLLSGLLIDIGNGLKRTEIIEEGRQLLQKDFEAISEHIELAPTSNYNLANANLFIFDLEMTKDPSLVLFSETKLDSAKFHYQKALAYEPKDQMLVAQILVNLGNCFDNLGRVIDALECYDQSLRLKPDFGMALGNKGKALFNYAFLCGDHQGTYTLEAYSLLNSAKNSGIYTEAAAGFSYYVKLIEEEYSNKLPLKNPPKYPGYKIKTRSKFEKFLVEFCLHNELYLNICAFCQKCDAAIGDTVTIKTMIVPAKDPSYLILSAYLNQIKQDYITARFLLILSRYEELNLNFVDKRVTIINTLDSSIHNIYIQLAKTSFKTFYDILDKIAFLINDYLKLGIPEREIDFTKLWYADKKKTVRSKITNTKNLSLNALFDIHRDLDYGVYRQLKDTRNALTHRFVNIRIIQESEDDKNMTEETLVDRTLKLAKIVSNSIIYLLHFVYVEEGKKTKIHGKTVPILAQAVPDKMKNTRKQSLKPKKSKKHQTT